MNTPQSSILATFRYTKCATTNPPKRRRRKPAYSTTLPCSRLDRHPFRTPAPSRRDTNPKSNCVEFPEICVPQMLLSGWISNFFSPHKLLKFDHSPGGGRTGAPQVAFQPGPCRSHNPSRYATQQATVKEGVNANWFSKEACRCARALGNLEPKWLRYTGTAQAKCPREKSSLSSLSSRGAWCQKSWQHPKVFPGGPPPQY